MSTRRSRWIRATIVLAAASAAMLTNSTASAEFVTRGSINDPANETRVTAGPNEARNVYSSPLLSRTTFAPGQTYTLVAVGTYQFNSGVYDAECSTDPTGTTPGAGWRANRWGAVYGTPTRDYYDLKGIYPDGSAVFGEWQPVDPYPAGSTAGEVGCSKINTYRATFTPLAPRTPTQAWFNVDGGASTPLKLTILGPVFSTQRIFEGQGYQCPKWAKEPVSPSAPPAGEIKVAKLSVDSRDNPAETQNPKADGYAYWEESGHWGMYTCNWALPASTYTISVKGTYQYIGGEMTRGPNHQYRGKGCGQSGNAEPCDGTHYWACSNPPASEPGQAPKPADWCWETTSSHLVEAFADAECATGAVNGDDVDGVINSYRADGEWKFDRLRGLNWIRLDTPASVVPVYHDYYDVYVEGQPLRSWQRDANGNWKLAYTEWQPAAGTRVSNDPTDNRYGCSTTHEYQITNWSPEVAGPVSIIIRDLPYYEWYNSGQLEITITKTGERADLPWYQ